MKVILVPLGVFPFHGVGGADKFPYFFAKYLTNEGVGVKIVTTSDKKTRGMEVYDGVEYVFLPPQVVWRKPIAPWAFLFSYTLARYLSQQKFDILHSFTSACYLYLHLKNRCPVVMQTYNLDAFQPSRIAEERGFRKLYYGVTLRHPWRYCLAQADAIAVPSDKVAKQLTEMGVDETKLFTLPQGIDILHVEERAKVNRVARGDLGLDEDDIVLLGVARFLPHKGLNYLVDAFVLIRQRIENAKLILIGRVEVEEERATYQQILRQISEYRLAGSAICRENVPEELLYNYYSISDIFISTSIWDDPLLMSVAEAMACGLPIVSTGQEMLVKSGLNGYLVPKRDPQAIAEAVVRIHYNNEYEAMGRMSREMIKNYELRVIAKKTVQKYSRLMGGSL